MVETSTKQKMQQARELIKAKRYSEARNILETVNHPTAYEWLNKLDEITLYEDEPAHAQSGGGLSSVIVVAVGVAALLIGIIIGAMAFPRTETTTIQETVIVPQTVVVMEVATQPAASERTACWKDEWWEEADPMIVNFLDVAETATQTSRMSLSGVILEMQQIYRNFQRVDRPECVADVQRNIESGMESAVQAFNDFLGQSEVLSSVYFNLATQYFADAFDQLLELNLISSSLDVRMSNTAAMIWGGKPPD